MKHICGQCQKGFDTEEEYISHVCEKSGVTPADPANLGDEFAKVSEAALLRGNKRVELEESGTPAEDAVTATRDLGKSVA